MSKSNEGNPIHTARTGRDVVSAVKFSPELTAAIDTWAETHQTIRSEAIRQLVELGLNAAEIHDPHGGHRDSLGIEDLAVREVGTLLDPSLAEDERERRIRRLTDGPPEFLGQRIDLPDHET